MGEAIQLQKKSDRGKEKSKKKERKGGNLNMWHECYKYWKSIQILKMPKFTIYIKTQSNLIIIAVPNHTPNESLWKVKFTIHSPHIDSAENPRCLDCAKYHSYKT